MAPFSNPSSVPPRTVISTRYYPIIALMRRCGVVARLSLFPQTIQIGSSLRRPLRNAQDSQRMPPIGMSILRQSLVQVQCSAPMQGEGGALPQLHAP